MDFINSIARARGTEQVLIDLITNDPVYLEIMEARFKFYYDMNWSDRMIFTLPHLKCQRIKTIKWDKVMDYIMLIFAYLEYDVELI